MCFRKMFEFSKAYGLVYRISRYATDPGSCEVGPDVMDLRSIASTLRAGEGVIVHDASANDDLTRLADTFAPICSQDAHERAFESTSRAITTQLNVRASNNNTQTEQILYVLPARDHGHEQITKPRRQLADTATDSRVEE